VIYDFYNTIDFRIGTHEILFSGSVGSGKSLLAAHLVIRHCIENPRARVLIGRRSLPDLKRTLFQKIVEHLDGSVFKMNVDYWINTSTATIKFKNGSEIIGASWADKRYLKFRSLELSLAVFEEAIENTGDDYSAIKEIRQRVGRLPHIKKNAIIYCTNPGSPSSDLYKYFFEDKSETRRVYFSLTEKNPHLPKTYIEQLKKDLDPKEARRMLYGEWVEIDKERIYYAYDSEKNFIKSDYVINPAWPITISFDFNIGHNKPMSCVFGQFDPNKEIFHFFDEVIIHGARTESVLEDAAGRGLLDHNVTYEVYGDATGAARHTNSLHSDYDIIRNFLDKYKRKDQRGLQYNMQVPLSNPPIRERHNHVNAYCLNTVGQRRLFVYQKCKILHEGMKLTALKEGSQYIEDDSKHYQHCTTAIGYKVVFKHRTNGQTRGYML
jgi:PBSX family phage terminase large subunit